MIRHVTVSFTIEMPVAEMLDRYAHDAKVKKSRYVSNLIKDDLIRRRMMRAGE